MLAFKYYILRIYINDLQLCSAKGYVHVCSCDC